MFGKLKGFVDEVFEDYIIFDVNNVGYQVFCSSKTINKIQNNKEKIQLYIETIVKEDSITLFGFLDLLEKEVFNTLCTVNGVGNKVCIKIMSILDVDQITYSIVNKDTKIFCTVPGIGPKLATRIVSELQGCSLIKNFDSNIKLQIYENGNQTIIDNQKILNDAINALENLGYQKNSIRNIVVEILKERPDLTLESVITNALKKINNF